MLCQLSQLLGGILGIAAGARSIEASPANANFLSAISDLPQILLWMRVAAKPLQRPSSSVIYPTGNK